MWEPFANKLSQSAGSQKKQKVNLLQLLQAEGIQKVED